MLFIALWWLSLVLGGVAGGLWAQRASRGKRLQLERVSTPRRRPGWQRVVEDAGFASVWPHWSPVIRGVAPRAGPPPLWTAG